MSTAREDYELLVRITYLKDLAAEMGVDYRKVVLPLSKLLGPEEDYDGLVTALQDIVSRQEEDEEFNEEEQGS